MKFEDYVAMEMKYYEEFYDELELLLQEYSYEDDVMDIEYTTAD